MSGLFPQRASNAEFLAYYNTLADDEEANGIDLQAEANGEEEENGDDDLNELKGLIDKRRLHDDDDEAHKALDASRRADEQREVEALARRFEERAHNYFDDNDDCGRDGGNALLREMQAAARKAARKAEAALRRSAAETAALERKAEAEKMAKKTAALGALYGELYAEDPIEEGAMDGAGSAIEGAAAPAVQKRKAGDAPHGGKRYRIKKKSEAD